MKLKMNAPLDPGFMPMAVVYREFVPLGYAGWGW